MALSSVLAVCATAHAQDPQPNPNPDPNQPPGTPPGTPPTTPPGTPPTTTPPTPTPGHDAFGGINANGLTPPPALSTPPPANTTDPAATVPEPKDEIRDGLDESKEDDSGRGPDWFWFEVEGGFEHVGLQTFNIDEQNFSVGLVETEASGGTIGAGVGAQLVFLTIGVRARMGFFDAWQMGRIGGEVGFRIPIGFVEPRFDLGGGYVGLGSFDGVVAETVEIQGFYLRAGAGVDFYPIDWLSIGGHATFDFMALTRPGLDPTKVADIAKDPDIGDLTAAEEQALLLEGSGYGATFALQGSIGLHF